MELGHDVVVGANTCIDRGSWRNTVIGDNTKLDNMVQVFCETGIQRTVVVNPNFNQVAHNVLVGHSCLLCAHAALAGSASIGDFVVMGGKSAIADHVNVL